MASTAVRALLTQAIELLSQETTDTVSEVVALQLKQQLREYQTLERNVARLTEERDYYRAAYISTLEAKTALLNGEIQPSDLK